MTDRNFARALPLVLRHEGGFVDNPKDPGGATNKGVTLKTFRAYVQKDATVSDLKKITADQVATVYYRHYWSAANCQGLPSGLDYAVFDFAVNSGPQRAVETLQDLLGVARDGRTGPKTIAAAQAAVPFVLVNQYCDARLAFLKRARGSAGALSGKLLWPTFGKGWQRRVNEVREKALAMVGKPADVKEVKVEIPVDVEKPTVPPVVVKEVEKKTGFDWKTIGGGGLLTAITTWLSGASWRTVAVVIGGFLIVGGLGIWGGAQLVQRIKEIKKEIEA